uniref:Uncharacterized protein n=1 Tax=Globisporangium ultimum (strain ATCC 200006 / CBS 805.95 / DAOM BR144) TaxID=431595 RepID=K3WRS2_GLOUD
MSLRTSRRSQQAGGQIVDVPSVPISEIRTRKWTKQLKTVGHLSVSKWVPGRKRQTVEIGRMTRSVRQHLDAPLELLSEYPAIRQSHGPRQTTPSTLAPPTALPTNASAPVAQTQAPVASSVPATDASGAVVGGAAIDVHAQQQPALAVVAISQVAQVQDASINSMPLSQGSDFMQLAASSDPLLAQTVPSDEQLEMALEDLPMLDSDEDLPFDQLIEDQVPSVSAPASAAAPAPVASPATESVEEHGSVSDAVDNTAESTADDDDDSDSSSSDDDDDESANSGGGSPMPSPSPQSSPMPSRSPSP